MTKTITKTQSRKISSDAKAIRWILVIPAISFIIMFFVDRQSSLLTYSP